MTNPILNFSINIELLSQPPLKNDTLIILEATPSIYPDNAGYTKTFEWVDHAGVDIGSANQISFYRNSGHHSVQVKISYFDGLVLVRTISQDYSFYVEQPNTKTYRFTTRYLHECVMMPYANMDIHRNLSKFPKYSSAYNNFFSNASKMVSPFSEALSESTLTLDLILDASYFDRPHFGFRDKEYMAPVVRIPKYIKTEYGICSYIGESHAAAHEAYPIVASELHAVPNPDLLTIGNGFTSLSKETHLFVKSIDASLSNSVLVNVYGIDKGGNAITENMNLTSIVPYETINKFIGIFKIESSRPVEITTYLNCISNTSFTNEIFLNKRITSKNGSYFEPCFTYEDRSVSINNAESGLNSEVLINYTDRDVSKFFVSHFLDFIYLSEGSLFATKLSLDYSQIKQSNSTSNNNRYMYFQEENTAIGDEIKATINTDLIKGNFDSQYFKIRIINRDKTYYVTRDMQISQDENNWIPLNQCGNFITFSISRLNTDQYNFELELSNRIEVYSAINYSLQLNGYKIVDNVDDILIYNKDLLVRRGHLYFRVDPKRLTYSSSNNKLSFANKFNTLEYLYE